jgi:hypothetical protein
MDETQGSDCGLAPQPRPAGGKALVARTEFSVFTHAECDRAWKIYCDWKQWRRFSDIYGEVMEWRGEPWQPGSRLRLEIIKPFPITLESQMIVCMPPRCMAWLTQADDYRVEHWVLFYPYNGGGTRISTWAEFSGELSLPGGFDARQALQEILVNWFAGFCRYCNRIVDGLQV